MGYIITDITNQLWYLCVCVRVWKWGVPPRWHCGYLNIFEWKGWKPPDLEGPWGIVFSEKLRLVGGCPTPPKNMSSSMGLGWHPIYEMKHKIHVPVTTNQQGSLRAQIEVLYITSLLLISLGPITEGSYIRKLQVANKLETSHSRWGKPAIMGLCVCVRYWCAIVHELYTWNIMKSYSSDIC